MIHSTTTRRRRWHSSIVFIIAAWLVLALSAATAAADDPAKNSTGAGSCTPSNCVAKCVPGCESDQICILGTMTTCGVCPVSTCFDRGFIGGGSTSSSSDNKGPLIGGLVGGLLGAGLVVSAIVYACLRYKQKRKQESTFPVAYTGNTMSQTLPPPSLPQQEQPQQTRQVSGVIPIAYVPPSPTTSLEHQQQEYNYTVRTSILQNRLSKSTKHASTISNPFADSNRTVVDDDDDDESVIQEPAQTYQVTRAKPQIMRVNTIRQQEEGGSGGLKRSGSTRTILTKEDERPSTVATTTTTHDNPFDDRHMASNKHTDSILSGPGDGEITIIWDGK